MPEAEQSQPLRGNPDLFLRIAENALTVAEDLREDYFKSTLGIARGMREEFRSGGGEYRIRSVPAGTPAPCAAAFVDGGLSRIDLGLSVPLIVRAGIFRVKQGERNLEARETFDHFPMLLGQLKGGLKASSQYGNVVRHIVELGAMVTALEDSRFDDVRLLMLHGPLQFVSGMFFEHWFCPTDYELMLGRDEREHVLPVLGRFTAWCKACPLRDQARCNHDISEQHLPAVCMLAFLQDYIFSRAAEKGVLVCGAVERSSGRGITRQTMRGLLASNPAVLQRLLEALEVEDRATSVQVEAILDATRYNDAVLLSLVLERGEHLDWYPVDPRLRNQDERVQLFPRVASTFVRTAAGKFPMRLEAPADYGAEQLDEVLARAFDYASLLPGYAFPIGLDIVDKFAAIPSWLTRAYRQMILSQYGRLLAGEYIEMSDVESLKMLAIMQGDGKRSRETRPKAE